MKEIPMKVLRNLLVSAAALGLAIALSRPTSAQTNLLTNGGFESVAGSTGASWSPWWIETAKPSDGSYNYDYKPSWSVELINNGAARDLIYAGNGSQRTINNWDPWTAGVKQIVSVPAGTRVKLTAVGRAWAASDDWPAPSDTSVPVTMKVGIDPNGTDYPTGGSQVVWSGGIGPHNGWQSVSVEATVGASGKVTVILYGTYRGSSRFWMATYWDEASLVATGTGTVAPTTAPGGAQPTAAPQTLPTPLPFVMPTAGPDGNIVYTVQPGDTGWGIALNAGISLDQLSALNGGININLLSVGQRLIIGQGKPSTPPTNTPAPPPTPDPNQPTSAPLEPTAATQVASINTGKLCARLYEDLNGNALREESEVTLAGGQFTLVDAGTGAPVQVYTTQAGEQEHCFENLPPAQYTLAVAPPAGFNPTTNTNYSLEIQTGFSSNIEFGAQRGSGATSGDTGGGAALTQDQRLRTALFGAAGIMLLLLAAGIAGFIVLRRR
jgi:hypothetical protein